MKSLTGIVLFVSLALAGCASQHTGDYGAYGSAHHAASDTRPVYRDPLYRKDCQKDYGGVSCAGN